VEGCFVEKDIQLGAVPECPFQSRPVSLVSYLCEEMPKDTKITKFPESRSGSNSVSNRDDSFLDAPEAWDGIDPFEEWEADDHFLSKGNYPGLVKLRERRLARRPDELDTQIGLGEAYILNGEYDKALAWLSGLHRKVPDHPDIQHLILDVLFATEKTEDDFPWVEKPTVVRLSSAVLDQCAEALKGKRKPRSAEELYAKLLIRWGYLLFTSNELLTALKQDSRFLVNDPKGSTFSSEVRFRRHRER
jgi:tetratricopeptide (TPR) repeat protein